MLNKNLNLHIRRFELKYVVSDRMLDKIRRSISPFVVFDPILSKTRKRFYRVTSLYLDTFNYDSYWEKVDGLKKHKKFRVRTYEEKLKKATPVFLEIKKREEAVIFKDRFLTQYGRVRQGIDNGKPEIILGNINEGTGAEFVVGVKRKNLQPTLLVSYRREAYFDAKNSSFRLTLDQDLTAARRFDMDLNYQDSQEIFRGYSILEAKFNRIMPAWFGMLIRSFNLNRISFSKYCFAAEACGIFGRPKMPGLTRIWI